jgi:serine/threonine protein kinase
VLADFGLAQLKSATGGGAPNGGYGSPFYMAPELLLEKPWNCAVDTYAFGVTLWEIVSRKTPFEGCESFSDLVDEVAIGGARPAPLPEHPPELPALLAACWDADPARRPSVVTVLSEGLVLDTLILAEAIPERSARDFWGSCFLRRTPNDVVPFGELIQAFCAYFKLGQLPGDDLGVLCLRALVADDHGDVSVESFGRSTRFFLPFGPAALAKMRDTLSAGWFHGPVSRSEAESALTRARKNGAYLIRYAQEDECAGSPSALLMLCVAGNAPVPIAVTLEGFEFKVCLFVWFFL